MNASAAKRPRPRKPYYELTELCEAWSLTTSDIAAFVLERELTLSVAVAGLRVDTFDEDEDMRGEPIFIPTGSRWVVGTMDLVCIDAWTVLQKGSCQVFQFRSADGERLELPDVDDEQQFIAVERSALVVRRAEKERFELAQELVQPPATEVDRAETSLSGRPRGAPPKYDWEGCWCEIGVMIYDPGPPRTQAEWLEKLKDWFTSQLGADNIPSDSAIKQRLNRIWHRVKPDTRRPSADTLIRGDRPMEAGEKGALRRR